ncbi:uncharacterized protein PAC_10672 [Phialocephala subalpina]|uniref:Uncharacterized protein n=1 Tax=Phialocephala subalpina TaxID=576137 RepID=A0A1L7X6X5_9HELO|nr:uncharacterized protein PAC_10672 [Phialocephala subalpina]
MAKISIAKILGSDRDQDAALLPTPTTWTSRVTRLPRRTLYFLIAAVLLIQSLITYRLFFYEPPLTIAPPYNVAETVGLITKWYELLQDMKYLGPDEISYPPHDINITLAQHMSLNPLVIETMQQMPYINRNTEGGWMGERDILYRDSRFVDYRNKEDLYLSRDPLGHWIIYNAKYTNNTFEEAMLDFDELFPKSAIPISIVRGGMWGTGDAIVLDTATNRFHVISTQGDGNRDYFFQRYETRDETPREYKVKRGGWYGPGIQYARTIPDALEDFILKTSSLDEGFVPGGVYTEKTYTPELCPPRWEGWVRDLYQKSGWPSVEVMKDYLFPRNITTPSRPFDVFGSSNFLEEMNKLKHNISVRYMPDWYLPVPRVEEYIQRLENWYDLTPEQIEYARSDEEEVPVNLKGWAGNYYGTKHWEVYGRGDWR